MKCQHCKEKEANRPRDLCWTCFEDREVRDLYPSEGEARRELAANRARPFGTPTLARPGSEAKIRVMIARAEANRSIFHPGDPTIETTPV